MCAFSRQEEVQWRLWDPGLVQWELKIKSYREKPLINSNRTPPGTERKSKRKKERGGKRAKEMGRERPQKSKAKEGQNERQVRVEKWAQTVKKKRERWWIEIVRRGKKACGWAGVNPIKRGCGCICSTYSKQILIYGRVIKLVLNLPAAPPYNYIHRTSVKKASDSALNASQGVWAHIYIF